MIINLAPFLLLAASFGTFIEAAPFNNNQLIKSPHPDVHEGADPHHVNKKWKEDKKFVDDTTRWNHGILKLMSQESSKPGLLDRSPVLMEGHDRMKKWNHFYGSEAGKKFDPKGRRKESAAGRATFAEDINDGVTILHLDEHPVYMPWESQAAQGDGQKRIVGQAELVAKQASTAKAKYEKASQAKKVRNKKP